MKDFIAKIKDFAKEGLFHIFGSSVLAQVGALITSMVVVRRLPKAEYGLYIEANNIYAYMAIFIGLGLATAMLQFCSEQVSSQHKNAIYRHSLIVGTVGNVVVFAAILGIAFAKSLSGHTQVAHYLLLMSGLPFAVYASTYPQMVLRIKLENQAYSYSNILYSVVSVLGNIIFSVLLGIPGLILAGYVANLVAAVKATVTLQKSNFFGELLHVEHRLSKQDKHEINRYAVICTLTNFASTMLVLLDVTCLALVIGDSEILADYKVAATIPAACAFIPSCLMTFFYPKLVAAFSLSNKNGQEEVKRISKIFLIVNGVVYLGLALGAPLIIWIIFGKKYMNTVPIFEVLSFNYFIYCQRHLYGNVIAAIKRVEVNLAFSIISGLLNIALNLILIKNYGSVGAALATVLVTCSIGVLSHLYLQRYYKKG